MNSPSMAKVKISSQVDEAEWGALQKIARESGQSISGVLTEAIADYVRKHQLRPVVTDHIEASIDENEELGRRLAK